MLVLAALLIPLTGLRTLASPSTPPRKPRPAARPAPPAVIFAGQDDALVVRDQLSRFYAELAAQNYSEALGFFSDITQDEVSRMLPLAIRFSIYGFHFRKILKGLHPQINAIAAASENADKMAG